jgi:Tol biopolymer transport system component
MEYMNTRQGLSAIAVLILLVACSGGSAPRASQPEPTTATLSAPAGTRSALTPLSGRIVFDNHQDVWSVNANGTDLIRLTHSPAFEFDPSWSPDGTQIAYRSDRGDESEIWVMNANGTGQRRLTAGLSPAWSPDGSSIAYSSPGHDPNPPLSGISIMNADGSGQHRVPNTDGGEYPSWSPDGKRIAFNSNLTGDHVMYIVDVDGSNLVNLSSVGEGWQVQWSPDGRSILFTSHRDHPDNYTDVYVMRPDGSGVKRLTHTRAYTPAWSPDGSRIVFSAPGLFVMRADGTGIEKLPVDRLGETSLPDWR